MKLDRLANSKRNIIWGLMGRIITTMLPFALRTVIQITIGEEYLGLSGLFTSMLSMLNLAELGLGSAMIYYMYKPFAEDNKKEICALLNLYKWLYRGIGGFILIVGICISPFIGMFVKGSCPSDINLTILYFIYLIDTVLSYSLFSYRQSLLLVHQRNDLSYKIELLINISLYAVQILLLFLFKNYYIFIIVKPIFTVINNILIFVITENVFPGYQSKGKVSKEKIVDIGKKVRALAGHKIGTTVVASADNIVISAFLGLSVVAKYGNYYTIMYAVISIMGMIMSSLMSGIGNGLVLNSKEDNYKLFNNINFLIMWLVSWCSICFLCLYQPFMTIWMGKRILLPFDSVILMVMYYYSWQCRVGVNLFKDAAGLWREDFWKPYVSAGVNIIANICLVKLIGLNGVLISTIIAMVFINIPWETRVLMKHVFQRSTGLYYLKQLWFLIRTCIAGVVTYFICGLFSLNGVFDFLVKGVICIVIPNIIIAILALKTEEFKYAKRMILNIVGIKR